MSDPAGGCDEHVGVADELRAFAITALDRLEPVLDRLRIEPPTEGSAQEARATCAVCPICALAAALRGERPELVQRLAEQLGGFVGVLREALAESATPAPPPARPPHPPSDPERTASGSPRAVQRIPVERVEARP